MRKLIVLSLLILGTVFAQSVSRNSATLPTLSAPIAQLDEATGWFLNKSGQWVSHDQVISSDIFADNFPDLVETVYGRSELRDFRTIELREVQHNGQEHLAFFVHHVTGYYRYPNILEDWREVDTLDVCVFQPEALSDLVRAVDNTGVAERVVFECDYGFILSERSTTGDLVEEAVRSIAAISRGDSNIPIFDDVGLLIIDVFPVVYEGREVVRFLWHSSSFYSGGFNPLVFDSRYFEVDFASFNALTRR